MNLKICTLRPKYSVYYVGHIGTHSVYVYHLPESKNDSEMSVISTTVILTTTIIRVGNFIKLLATSSLLSPDYNLKPTSTDHCHLHTPTEHSNSIMNLMKLFTANFRNK